MGTQQPGKEFIRSLKDDRIIEARALSTAKGRKERNKFLLEGIQQISWAQKSGIAIDHLFIHDRLQGDEKLIELEKLKLPLYLVTEGILKKITDTNYLIPAVAVASSLENEWQPDEELLVVLDDVRDHGNIGTIIRTAAAFGLHQFVSSNEAMDLYYRKTVDASRGAVFRAQSKSFQSSEQLVSYLKKRGYQIVVTTPHESVIQSLAVLEKKPTAIVFGNETHGASDIFLKEADVKIQIPMTGGMESLNVGVAAGISLFEMKVKVIMMMLVEKIKSSFGRNLGVASRWMRTVFDQQLKTATPVNADQAVMMMIIKCDGSSTRERITRDAGLFKHVDANAQISALVDGGYLSDENGQLILAREGEELLAKVWFIHEQTEGLVLEGFSVEEKRILMNFLERIQKNCEKHAGFQ